MEIVEATGKHGQRQCASSAVFLALAHLQPIVSVEPATVQVPKASKFKRTQTRTNGTNGRQCAKPAQPTDRPNPPHPLRSRADHDDEREDLTAEDLRRLRGEIPLSSSPKKIWKH